MGNGLSNDTNSNDIKQPWRLLYLYEAFHPIARKYRTINYDMFTYESEVRKAYAACNCNSCIETKGLLKVTGSQA